jgi:hypothetical protein
VSLAFRAALPDDLRFVVSSWSSSYKEAHQAGAIRSERWAEVMRPEFEAHLARPDARVVVAFERKDPAFIFGWIAGDTAESVPVVFYVYVKAPYRLGGIARQLFEAFGVRPEDRFAYACSTPVVPKVKRSIPSARFSPVLRYPKERRA